MGKAIAENLWDKRILISRTLQYAYCNLPEALYFRREYNLLLECRNRCEQKDIHV